MPWAPIGGFDHTNPTYSLRVCDVCFDSNFFTSSDIIQNLIRLPYYIFKFLPRGPDRGGGFKDTPPILRVCDVRLDSNFFTSYDNSKIDKVIKLKFNMIVNLQGSEMVTLF